MPQAHLEARLYMVRGRVQGVGYRNFVQQAGDRLQLTGWTRNLDDGRVQVFAQGLASSLHELEVLLWKGPQWADVRGVDATGAGPENLRGFVIRS